MGIKSPIALSLTVLAVTVVVDFLLKEHLWDYSLRFQTYLQSNWPELRYILTIISSSALLLTLFPPSLFFYFNSPLSGVNMSLVTFLALGLGGLLKMLYQDPRPYWVSSNVKGLVCEEDWGTPSGHALVTAAVWGTVAVSLYRKGRSYTAFVILACIFIVGFSRVYLGAHFVSQVLLGWAWGGLLTALYSVFTSESGRIGKKTYRVSLGSTVLLGALSYGVLYHGSTWEHSYSVFISQSCSSRPIDPQAQSFIETSCFAWLLGLLVVAYLSQSSSAYHSVPSESRLRKCVFCALSLLPVLAAVCGVAYGQRTQDEVKGWVVALGVNAVSGVLFGLLPRLIGKKGALLEGP